MEKASLFTGSLFATLASLAGSLNFVVPELLRSFTPFQITLGRYLCYGALSLFWYLFHKTNPIPRALWKQITLIAFVSSFGYSTSLILATRYTHPALCTLILGLTPIATSFYGNWKERSCPFKALILPALATLTGLVLVNISHLKEATSLKDHLLGIFFALLALIATSWSVTVNALVLKKNPTLSSSDWTVATGIATLLCSLPLIPCLLIPGQTLITAPKGGKELAVFLSGSLALALLSSCLGGLSINEASKRLPTTLLGQLSIFKTLFGLLFVFLLRRELPSLFESVAIGMFLSSVLYTVRLFAVKLDLV